MAALLNYPYLTNKGTNMEYNNVFEVKQNIERFGIWYALWFHGTNGNALWTIFVAWQMIRHNNKKYSMTT